MSLEQQIEQATSYLRLLAKRKWEWLIGTFALTLLFTVIIAKLPNIYEATTAILVDPQQVPEKYVSAAVSSDAYARLNTITQQVLSRSRLQEIIDKLNLYPDLRGSLSPEELVEGMRRDITIEVKQGSGPELSTFSLTYQGKQPAVVAKVANELASSFIQWSITSRVQQVAGTKDFLSSELMSAKQNLERQENTLRQFKMSHLGEMPDQTGSNLQALANLRSALQADADAMNRFDQERTFLLRTPEPLPVASNTHIELTQRQRLELEKHQLEEAIEQLREHYSDRYPDVVRAARRLEELKDRLNSLPADPPANTSERNGKEGKEREESVAAVRLEIIDKQMKKLEVDQNLIQSQIESYQAKVDAAPIREQQLVELTRNYDISKQHYQVLLDKSFNVAMAADLEQNQKAERFRVLDPAQVPQKPVKPHRKKLIPLSALLALGLSIFCVLLKEEFSPAIKTETELKSLLPAGVLIWGSIPRIEVPSDARRGRRWAICASLTCLLLCLALIRVIREIRPL
jgi:polysaccharide chain length determinant protein (PEP-CTERM system associated)